MNYLVTVIADTDPIIFRKYAKLFFHNIVKFPALFCWESIPTKNLYLIDAHILKYLIELN